MMMKSVMEVAQDCTLFEYVPLIPQKDLKPKDLKNIGRARDEAGTKLFSPTAQKREICEGNPPRCVDNG